MTPTYPLTLQEHGAWDAINGQRNSFNAYSDPRDRSAYLAGWAKGERIGEMARKVRDQRVAKGEACLRMAQAHGSGPHADAYTSEARQWGGAAIMAARGWLAPFKPS